MKSPEIGQLIVFEGGDGIGKSHLAGVLTDHLKGAGVSVLQLSFPGKREGSLGRLVYEIHHKPAEFDVAQMTPLALQTLHIAAHLEEITSMILPSLADGIWVVLDRYWWSTWVYGIATGADRECLELLIEAEKKAWRGILPAAVFVVERESALREESDFKTFQVLARLYAEIRGRERTRQPTYVLDNNDLEGSQETLKRIANEAFLRTKSS